MNKNNEQIGNWIKNKSTVPQVLNDNRILELIRRNKMKKAVKLMSLLHLNSMSLFNSVYMFGNVYDKIPFVMAALGLYVEKTKNPISMCEKIISLLNELFIPNSLNNSNMFDAKFTTSNGSTDVLSFILTHDNQIKPKKYNSDIDKSIYTLLMILINNGYSLNNYNCFIKYIIENDLIISLKYMASLNKYIPDSKDIDKYGISIKSNVGKFLSNYGTNKFKFQENEISHDDKGKITGGELYKVFKSIGYDISKINKEQKIHLSAAWMIKDTIENVISSYISSGNQYSNITEFNLSGGSSFMDATLRLKDICSKYFRLINDKDYQLWDNSAKEKKIVLIINDVNTNIEKLQNDLNRVLSNLNFPCVNLIMNNMLEGNETKIRFKMSAMMKELWNSVKVSRL